MSQINKYADKAAYEADAARLKTLSSESYIENDGELIYDGVNTVIRKSAAGVGDLVVFDKTDSTLKFIKGDTLVTEKIPPQLIPVAVVYARQGDRVLIVSLENATVGSQRWAYSYEVALSGFDLAAGGTAVLSFGQGIYAMELPITYAAGASLADIAAQINANATVKSTYGWTASVDEATARIIVSSNTWHPDFAIIKVVSGCQITRPPEDVNYQTTLTGVLIEGATDPVRRKNGVDASLAGCNPEEFLRYYSANGSEKPGQQPGSGEIIRESAFTEEANPALVAAYPTYRDYLFGEHLLQYPAAYGALLRDGKTDTHLIGRLTFEDIYGKTQYRYPAAAAALDYGITVEGATTGLEAGAWWLPSVDEIYLLMHDRVLTAADVEKDPVNRTLSRLGKATCYGSNTTFRTSCEHNYALAFVYNGYTGNLNGNYKYNTYFVRTVSAL
ncbi:flagellin hook IN motif-containing protein [Alistipes onderdonkii]|uniref:flagellin hook IN motif-containing protein n=1 Tax=Alistipes onderdonkii TaxID=328813 RepID=UPI00050A279E|nr:flagellin hook IN motif-containing protein [Alistipes onderdonkii]